MGKVERKRLSDGTVPAWKSNLVSVVVLNWNGGDDVVRCIDYVAAQTYPHLEIILIDNGSIDGSVQSIHEVFPQVSIWENGRNLGYAEGMNVGISRASGEFVVLLNQDAFLRTDYIEKAVELFRSDDAIGMVAGTVLKVDSKPSSSAPVMSCGQMMRWHMRPIGNQDCVSRRIIFGPGFACAMIRRSTLDDVRCKQYGDYFDQDYFAYHEDIDFCFRAILLGWHTVYSPGLVVWHRESGASGGKIRLIDKSLELQRHAFKNRHITVIKDLPLTILVRVVPIVVVTDVLILLYLFVKSPRSLLAWTSAFFDILRLLPKILKRRKSVQARVIISTKQLRQYFVGL